MATKTKTVDPNAGKKRYIAQRRISNRQGNEVWNRGAEIWMDDKAAAMYLAKGIIAPADETKAPTTVSTPVTIHEPEEATDGDANSTAA